MSLNTQPDNVNFLSPVGFKLVLARAPATSFFLQNVTIPGLTMPSTIQPTPFVKIPIPGDHIDYDDLQITFKIDENLSNWLEIHNWMEALGFPDKFEQYKALADKENGDINLITSDITVTILNSAMNPNLEFKFEDAFPVSLGSFDLNTTDASIDYVSSNATFKYRKYTITKL
jgi:hypothetical protein